MKLRFLTLVSVSVLALACSSEDPRPPSLNPIVDSDLGDFRPDLGGNNDGSETGDTAVSDAADTSGGAPTGADCAVDADCADKKCDATSKKCSAPLCTDSVKNGTETDTDCGGASCPGKCAAGKGCVTGADCTTAVCGTDKLCAAATCSDSVKNGGESDIDCGGTTLACKRCGVGLRCTAASDCASNVCLLDAGTLTCLCPSGMTRINVPGGGGTYCMDQAEVTNEQYAKLFLGTGPSTGGQPAQCTWNTDYVPTVGWPAPESRFGYPVRGVDWCDAYAYCAKQGKTLCGKIGGGETPVASYNDNLVSKWHNACSQGPNAYPYSISTYEPTRCNGAGFVTDGGVPDVYAVLTFGTTTVFDPARFLNKSCIGGPLSDIYQLSGNVAEWEDSCTAKTGGSDKCLVRGGSFKSDATGLRCDASRQEDRSTKSEDIGFRCCL